MIKYFEMVEMLMLTIYVYGALRLNGSIQNKLLNLKK